MPGLISQPAPGAPQKIDPATLLSMVGPTKPTPGAEGPSRRVDMKSLLGAMAQETRKGGRTPGPVYGK